MPTIVCPNCRSSNVRRSRTRGVKEKLLKIVGEKAFRCRDCGWRGMVMSRGGQSSSHEKGRSYVFAIVLCIIVVVLIIVINFRAEQIERLARSFFGNSR